MRPRSDHLRCAREAWRPVYFSPDCSASSDFLMPVWRRTEANALNAVRGAGCERSMGPAFALAAKMALNMALVKGCLRDTTSDIPPCFSRCCLQRRCTIVQTILVDTISTKRFECAFLTPRYAL